MKLQGRCQREPSGICTWNILGRFMWLRCSGNAARQRTGNRGPAARLRFRLGNRRGNGCSQVPVITRQPWQPPLQDAPWHSILRFECFSLARGASYPPLLKSRYSSNLHSLRMNAGRLAPGRHRLSVPQSCIPDTSTVPGF